MIRAIFPAGKAGTTNDIYLLDRNPRQSFKLRDRTRLELKCLRGHHRKFQIWVPAGLVQLPATGRQIADGFSTCAAMPTFSHDGKHDPQVVLSGFRRFGSRAVGVTKHRVKYDAHGLRAEHVRLAIDDMEAAETVAVEGSDPLALSDILTAIGMSSDRNVSYPEFLSGRDRHQNSSASTAVVLELKKPGTICEDPSCLPVGQCPSGRQPWRESSPLTHEPLANNSHRQRLTLYPK